MIPSTMDAEPESTAQPGQVPIGAAQAAATKPSRRAVISRALLLVGIVVVVFVVILPRVVDFGEVRNALATLSVGQLAALVAVTLVAYVANAAPMRILIPALTWPRAVGSDLAARAVVSTIPGPTDIATRFVLYRQWSIPADTATAGIVFAAFFETMSALVLPVIATIGVVLTGEAAQPAVLWLSVIGLLVFAVAVALIVGIVRSEPLARRVGKALQSIATRLWRLVKRTPPTGIEQGVLDVRERSKDTLSRHGLGAFGAAVLAKLTWFLVLEIALWSVGISPDVLPPSAVLAAMAAVALVALIPITPGAVGVSEVAYIGFLSAVGGSELTGQITAAIVIYRAMQWLAPIPIGWILLVIMRGSHWRDLDQPAATVEGTTQTADLPAKS
jgi:putative heme transporter